MSAKCSSTNILIDSNKFNSISFLILNIFYVDTNYHSGFTFAATNIKDIKDINEKMEIMLGEL